MANSAPTVSILRIPVRAGSEAVYAEAFARLRVFERAATLAGFRSGRLLRPVAEGEPFAVVAEWDGPEWYERWLEHPAREELGDGLDHLVDGEMTGVVFTEVYAR
jgi:heme-degrading monooxygenase HmoA